jgi:hypothetical protein
MEMERNNILGKKKKINLFKGHSTKSIMYLLCIITFTASVIWGLYDTTQSMIIGFFSFVYLLLALLLPRK